MDGTGAEQLRAFIMLTETREVQMTSEDTTDVSRPVRDERLRKELTDLVDRYRSIMENSGGDYALGYEAAMQRAAEMLENVLRRCEDGNGPEIL